MVNHGEEKVRVDMNVVPRNKWKACFGGFDKGPGEEKFCYCSHNFRAQIENSVQLGKITVDKNLCSV